MSDETNRKRLFEVRGSEPKTEARAWRGNFVDWVLAERLEDAVAHVVAKRPEGSDLHEVLSRSGQVAVQIAGQEDPA